MSKLQQKVDFLKSQVIIRLPSKKLSKDLQGQTTPDIKPRLYSPNKATTTVKLMQLPTSSKSIVRSRRMHSNRSDGSSDSSKQSIKCKSQLSHNFPDSMIL